jgi:hypothetical protein
MCHDAVVADYVWTNQEEALKFSGYSSGHIQNGYILNASHELYYSSKTFCCVNTCGKCSCLIQSLFQQPAE